MIRIAGIVKESIVDGEGFRFTIFTQGCPHHCEGCHNPQTWDFSAGEIIDEDELIKEWEKNPLLQGVTFSGGEPFMQAEVLEKVADAAHSKGLDVWSWTGFTYEKLMELPENDPKRRLLSKVDVLVDGPFVLKERDISLTFRGSRNQRVIDMNKTRQNGEVTLWCE